MKIYHKKIVSVCFSAWLLCSFLAAENIVEMISDPLKLVIYPKTGNFCLYHTKPENIREYEPLYDDRSQSSVNIYSVLFNGKMFHLNNKSGKKIVVHQANNEITLTFQISLDLLATQTFSFVPSKQRSTGPLLKIVTEVQNISGEIANIALKAVFDTSLGEKNIIPLYTDLRSEIGSELMLQPVLEKDTVVFSADKGYACLFFLRNEYMTTPSSVYIANWERLVTRKWLPSYVSGRSFRKFTTSDPGLLYVWSERKVPHKASLSVTNCIGFYDYRSMADTATGFTAYTEPPVSQTIRQPAAAAVKPTAAAPEVKPADSPAPPKKDYGYVQKLLDKIAELEQSPDELSTEEIRKLRTEVDNAIEAMQEE